MRIKLSASLPLTSDWSWGLRREPGDWGGRARRDSALCIHHCGARSHCNDEKAGQHFVVFVVGGYVRLLVKLLHRAFWGDDGEPNFADRTSVCQE